MSINAEIPSSLRPTSIDGVCHHCGRLLRNSEIRRIETDPYFSGDTGAIHCVACARKFHPDYRSPWFLRLFRWMIRFLLRVLFFLIIGVFLAALIKENVLWLGDIWQQLKPIWSPISPYVTPYLKMLTPFVQLTIDLFRQVQIQIR